MHTAGAIWRRFQGTWLLGKNAGNPKTSRLVFASQLIVFRALRLTEYGQVHRGSKRMNANICYDMIFAPQSIRRHNATSTLHQSNQSNFRWSFMYSSFSSSNDCFDPAVLALFIYLFNFPVPFSTAHNGSSANHLCTQTFHENVQHSFLQTVFCVDASKYYSKINWSGRVAYKNFK